MTTKLDLRTSQHDQVCILHCQGMLDGHTAPDFDRTLGDLVEQRHDRIVLDLAGLTYIASAGVGVMINYLQQLQNHGGCLHIANPTTAVGEIFNLLGLQTLLQIHDDLDAAVQAASA
jgi:anti-sigma B factor antagonist